MKNGSICLWVLFLILSFIRIGFSDEIYNIGNRREIFVDDELRYIFLPFYCSIQTEWRPSRNNAILEECFDKALEKYEGMPDWINQKNIRLKQIRTLQIEGLNLALEQLGAFNKESKAV